MEEWEALPKRSKTRKKQSATSSASSSSSSSLSENNSKKLSYENRLEMITNAISERSAANKAHSLASLTSLDGCAGENFEYLDHTADVQCHTWGSDLKSAFETMGTCMFNYMTDLSTVEIDLAETRSLSVKAHDLQSLLFKYMDEMLYKFCSDSFCVKKVEISKMDLDSYEIEAQCFGNIYNPEKNPPGTEIKAITYSNMQIHQSEDRADLYVIVDI